MIHLHVVQTAGTGAVGLPCWKCRKHICVTEAHFQVTQRGGHEEPSLIFGVRVPITTETLWLTPAFCLRFPTPFCMYMWMPRKTCPLLSQGKPEGTLWQTQEDGSMSLGLLPIRGGLTEKGLGSENAGALDLVDPLTSC